MHPKYRLRPIAMAACVAAMLSGCGGGSSSTMPDDNTMSRDDMMTGGETATPVGLMAGVDRFFSSDQTERLADDGSAMVRRTAEGWELTIGGRSVVFTEADRGAHAQLGPSRYYKEYGTHEVAVFQSEDVGGFDGDPAAEFDYMNVYAFAHHDAVPGADLSTLEPDDFTRGDYIYVVHGTPTSEMPVSGTATYAGRVEAREWRSEAAVFSPDTGLYEGSFDMTATFGASGTEIAGAFSFPGVPGGTIPFATSVSGNRLSVDSLDIDSGAFAGYENIGVHGAFFGPAAEEVGGVFDGENPTRGTLMHGYFTGAQQ